MNAGRILRASGYDTDELRALLDPVNPDEVNVWLASPLLRRIWRGWVRGMTLWRLVVVDPELLIADRDAFARVVAHELVHVRQYREQGWLPFNFRYAVDYLTSRLAGSGHRRAYLDIAAEREARSVVEGMPRSG